MDSKLLIACAGAGKTTFLVNKALEMNNKRILITTFTDENTESIKNKIIKKNKSIPSFIKVQPWFSFLLEHCVRPFQGKILKEEINGLILISGKSAVRYYLNGVPVCWPESDLKHHYFSKEMYIFSDKISKFAIKCNDINNNLVLNRLKTLYDYIFIDEIQDMAGYDFQLIKNIMESGIKVIMVGDPRQSTFTTHYDSKYKQYSGFEIKKFFSTHCKDLCQIDENTLNTTHRCNQEIIEKANNLYPDLQSSLSDLNETGEFNGIYFIFPEEMDKLTKLINPIVIRYNKNYYNGNLKSINVGKSKGLEFDYTLLFLTKDMISWFFKPLELKNKTRSNTYIALTRAKYACFIVIEDQKYVHKLKKIKINDLCVYKLP